MLYYSTIEYKAESIFNIREVMSIKAQAWLRDPREYGPTLSNTQHLPHPLFYTPLHPTDLPSIHPDPAFRKAQLT